MTEQILKAAEYIESLEQRIAALEARMAEQEAYKAKLIDLSGRITELAEESKIINQRCTAIVERTEELLSHAEDKDEEGPEVEVELIVADEPEEEEETVSGERLEVSGEEPEAVVEEPIAEPEPEPEVEPEPEPIAELEPVVEQEPMPTPTPTEKPRPVQTSLFGTPVSDIRQAISLGDRFLFQRELFGGKGELMQKTLDQLDQLSSLGEALTYIGDKFQWDKESSTYELFVNVLRRRFS